ncbi:MAG: trypsin-like peptidase domain-containing protein [Pseudomonadota bacterium]
MRDSTATPSLLIYWLKAAVVGLAAAFIVVWFNRGFAEPPTDGYADAVAVAAPAVVYLYTSRSLAERGQRLGGTDIPVRREVPNNVGSGVVIRHDGLIVTNEHLLRNAENIYVVLRDGAVLRATIIGIDADTDLALLDVDATDLPTIKMGRSDTLRIGQVVLAIGNAFGIGQTVTQGIVSATDRDELNLNRIEQFIQTDASINPGNSGGALVDTAGRLIGINSAVINPAGSEGISFAIPVNLVRGVSNQLLEHGRVIRGWLGLQAGPVPPHLVDRLGILSGGIIVTAVQRGSPAELAGIGPGDVIIAVNDQPVPRVKDAVNRISNIPPGGEVLLRILRGGQTIEARVRVIEQPALSGG